MIGEEADVHYFEELGIILQSQGYMVDEQEFVYYSSFIKIPDPANDTNLCAQGCAQDFNLFNQAVLNQNPGCMIPNKKGAEGLGKTMETISLGRAVDDTKGGRRGACILECLRHRDCQAVEIQEEEEENTGCILRLENLEEHEMNVTQESI